VPLDRVVTGGDNEPGPGMVMLHRELHRGRRYYADIDDLDTHRHEARGGGSGEHRSAGARIPPQDDDRLAVLTGPGTKGRSMARDEFGCQVLADNATHAGSAVHQGVGNGRKGGWEGGRAVGREGGKGELG